MKDTRVNGGGNIWPEIEFVAKRNMGDDLLASMLSLFEPIDFPFIRFFEGTSSRS